MGLFKNKKSFNVDDKSIYTDIFSAIEDAVILFDSQGIIRLFNTAASTLTGWPQKDALSLDIKTVVKLADNKGIQYKDTDSPFTRVFSLSQTVKDNNSVIVAKNGEKISVNVGLFPLKSSADNITAAVAIIRNVTEERKKEERLADFISTASHEMRTPVAAIEGYLALALNQRVSTIDSRAREYLEKAHLSTQSLGVLFQDLLTSAKAEDGRLISRPTVLDLGAFLKDLSEDLKFTAEKKGLKTEFVTGSANGEAESSKQKIVPLYYAYVDQNRIKEVMTNIFDNAVKFTNSGRIIIGLTGDDSVVQLYIKDTGIGIPKPDVPHLFQKFYRVDNSQTRTVGGTGLGLYICQKIIELYNGRIWVESELGKGSTFYINLPRLTTLQANAMKAGEQNPSGETEPETISTS